jgi:hypothetical protein
MDTLQEGISSKDVQEVQHLINEYYQQSVVAENGEFDKDTTKAVMRFQKDAKLRATGAVDPTTMQALKKPPLVKGHKFTFNNKDYFVAEKDWPVFQKQACQQLKPLVDPYDRRATETANMWKAHDQVRKDTFFLIKIMVDVSTGAKFPPQSLITGATSAVGKMKSTMAGGDAKKLQDAIDDGHKAVDDAVCAMSMYRDVFYAGSAQLVTELEQVRDGCKTTLSVLAIIATGGASIAVTAGVMGAVGSYDELLDQIDKASVKKVDPLEAFGDVIKAGVIDATVGALTADGGVVDKFAEKIAAKVGATVLKTCGKKAAEEFVKTALKNMLKEDFGDLIETILKSFKPGAKKLTWDDFIKEMEKNAAKNAAFGLVMGGIDKQLEDVCKNWAKGLGDATFKGLGKVDVAKAVKAGADKCFEEAMKRLTESVLEDAADDKNKAKKVDEALIRAMEKDQKLNASLAKLVKDKKLGD